MMRNHSKKSERGNVLFYILIAVALLAALSFAVSQGGRGSFSDLTEEQTRLYASEIIEYGNVMSNAVTQLRLRGVLETELCFDDPAWGVNDYDHAGCTDDEHKIFHPDGAGLIWRSAPPEAMDSAATPDNLFHIYIENEIQNIGTSGGNPENVDLLLVVNELKLGVCQQINGLLGVTTATASPPTDADLVETRFIGVYDEDATIGDTDSTLEGQRSACYFQGGTDYVYYKVLLAR